MNYEKIILGTGCFWCTEALFKTLEGIKKVTPGYCGGTEKNITYEEVCSGTTEFIEVVELYDFHHKMMYFWSPNWKMGEKFLLQAEMPFQDAKGDAVSPIVPLYFNRLPDKPLDGYSAMRRIYDQIYETNMVRTFQANAVRKASRQYLVKKGVLDEEQMAAKAISRILAYGGKTGIGVGADVEGAEEIEVETEIKDAKILLVVVRPE